MMVSVEASGSLERRMKVQVPAERIDNEVIERLRRFGKNAKIKGFRPGKAPLKVIKQQYGKQVRQEVLGEVMQSSYTEAISQENLQPAGGPRIETDSVAEGKDLEYTAVFEVYPEIELKGIEGIKVERPEAAIESDDIDRMVDNLRRQKAEWEALDGAADDGDRVTLDFIGRLDDVPFDGGEGKDVPVVVGAGQMLKDFEDALAGVSAGEKKTFDVAFPEDYPAENLAGKTAQFDGEIKKVERQALPVVDEEFCKLFGVTEGGVEKLRDEVRNNMEGELAQNVRGKVKQQVLDALLEANSLDLPTALVDEEVRNLQMDAARRMGVQDASQLPPAEVFREQADRRVSLGLLVNELIRSQNIELDADRVTARLEEIASAYAQPEEIVKAYRSDRQLMGQIELMVLEDQVVDWLLERAKVKTKKTSFRELMKFETD